MMLGVYAHVYGVSGSFAWVISPNCNASFALTSRVTISLGPCFTILCWPCGSGSALPRARYKYEHDVIRYRVMWCGPLMQFPHPHKRLFGREITQCRCSSINIATPPTITTTFKAATCCCSAASAYACAVNFVSFSQLRACCSVSSSWGR